jgi:hypothetical protein
VGVGSITCDQTREKVLPSGEAKEEPVKLPTGGR